MIGIGRAGRTSKGGRLVALVLAVLILVSVGAAATGIGPAPHIVGNGESEAAPTPAKALSEVDASPGLERGALPCTKESEPANFDVFSAGPAPAGLPLTGTSRRCDVRVPASVPANNYVNYSYGDCEIPAGSTGCAPPLAIQTWPACQRSRADYSFEGKPLPFRKLPSHGGAEVVEFPFDGRLEVYTKRSTIVIFAADPRLARQAVELLRLQDRNKPPAKDGAALGGPPPEGLAPPSDGSLEGTLPCQS